MRAGRPLTPRLERIRPRRSGLMRKRNPAIRGNGSTPPLPTSRETLFHGGQNDRFERRRSSAASASAVRSLVGLTLWVSRLLAAELVTLHPDNYAQFAPDGKETDAIYGDYVLRNDRVIAVVADPTLVRGRSASRKTSPSPMGCIMDFTRRERPNDLLAIYLPAFIGTGTRDGQIAAGDPGEPHHQSEFPDEALTWKKPGREPKQGPRVVLSLPFEGRCREVRYVLEDGWDFIQVEADFENRGDQPVEMTPASVLYMGPAPIRSRQFLVGDLPEMRTTWIYDPWFGQAYALAAVDHETEICEVPTRDSWLMQRKRNGPLRIPPRKRVTVVKRLFPGADAFCVCAAVARSYGTSLMPLRVRASDPEGPVPHALVKAYRGEVLYAAGRTDAQGLLSAWVPAGRYRLGVAPAGRTEKSLEVDAGATEPVEVRFPAAAAVRLCVVDESGSPIPCKVEVRGVPPTPDPFFFPETGEDEVGNLRYTVSGSFSQILPPGHYEMWVSHGPEYEFAVRRFHLEEGEKTSLTVTVARAFETPGWISADFGNRSTKSFRRSLASPRGRVLNLVAEHIEFAPSTEDDFIFSYESIVRDLGVASLLATCPGIHLTERVRKTVTSQNAFPVIYRPGYQDGGAPQRPQHVFQVYWLNGWYGPLTPRGDPSYTPGSEKLIQVTPPGIWEYDARWHGMWSLFGATEMLHAPLRTGVEEIHRNCRMHEVRCYHAMEVQPLEDFLTLPTFDPTDPDGARDQAAWQEEMDKWARQREWPTLPQPNLWWLRILNQGWRITGVVNGNAYHNFHGSGRVRNYIRVPEDRPASVTPLDIVRAVKAGRVVMTTGPFLEVRLRAARNAAASAVAGPGEDIQVPEGKAFLHVRVQCGAGADVDTVRVLFNGRPVPSLTHTRSTHPQAFHNGALKFQADIPLEMGVDTRVMVLASGTGPNLHGIPDPEAGTSRREVPVWPRRRVPHVQHVALSNPIYVDVDGNGFKPHPPSEDRVHTRVDNLTPLASSADASPARLRMLLKNLGTEPASDTFSAEIRPKGAAEVVGENRFSYRLMPGELKAIEFSVRLTPGTQAKVIRVGIPRSSVGPGRRACAVTLEVDRRTVRDPNFNHESNWWLPEQDVQRPPHWFWPEAR